VVEGVNQHASRVLGTALAGCQESASLFATVKAAFPLKNVLAPELIILWVFNLVVAGSYGSNLFLLVRFDRAYSCCTAGHTTVCHFFQASRKQYKLEL
jgi:hypothetical protein